MARRPKPKPASEEPSIADLVPGPPPNERRRQLAAVADDFKGGGWLPARQVLTKVRSVPTIFPQVDRGARVGGWPIDRIGLVHGPSNEGKTTFVNGLGLSFLVRDHFYALIDAEFTTPITWLEKQMGEYADHPGFVALRPRTYEETIGAVRKFATRIGEAKAKKQIPEDTTGLIVVDSIKKLVPEGILSKIVAEAKSDKKMQNGADGMRGMAGSIKAAMNAAWLDELVPLLAHTGTALVAIGRETQDRDADARDRKFGMDWKLSGGGALFFDSSIVVRIERASWVYEKEKVAEGEKPGRIFGERHLATIRKTKVEGKEDKVVKTYFHTSNGVHVPEGFDRPRDVLELALDYEIVKQLGGGWMTWGKRRWQGKHAAVAKMHNDPEVLAELEAAVRERFSPDEDLPGEEDE